MRAVTSQISCRLLVGLFLKGVCLFQTDGELPVKAIRQCRGRKEFIARGVGDFVAIRICSGSKLSRSFFLFVLFARRCSQSILSLCHSFALIVDGKPSSVLQITAIITSQVNLISTSRSTGFWEAFHSCFDKNGAQTPIEIACQATVTASSARPTQADNPLVLHLRCKGGDSESTLPSRLCVV